MVKYSNQFGHAVNLVALASLSDVELRRVEDGILE
jgi:hypothetical protein